MPVIFGGKKHTETCMKNTFLRKVLGQGWEKSIRELAAFWVWEWQQGKLASAERRRLPGVGLGCPLK